MGELSSVASCFVCVDCVSSWVHLCMQEQAKFIAGSPSREVGRDAMAQRHMQKLVMKSQGLPGGPGEEDPTACLEVPGEEDLHMEQAQGCWGQ